LSVSDPPGRASDDNVVWERWDEVDGLFEAALDLPPEERERFIEEACRGDLELLRTLRELIAITESGANRVTGPGEALVRAAWSTPDKPAASPLEPGQRIGPYRIVTELGRGGMATVYIAERADGSFQRRVALKVLRRGVDTDDVVRRFLAERQILSNLTHPNIARLLDGGATEDGRPYLVMDLVSGEPITRYADRHRITIRERLLLFLQVAEAVQYAHQRLVVHRDLKPSNILVTTEGQAKLLDFGIAKLLNADADDAPHTRAGVHPLTPQYASPEQLQGGAITTASDVYQLGVLLHILLAGARPSERTAASVGDPAVEFTRPSQLLRVPKRARSTTQVAHDVTHIEAIAAGRSISPEALQRALRGDLDTILLRALRTEPDQRYDSPLSMAADVRRHLDGLPITARPPTVRYRLRKFIGRNHWLPPVAALVVVGVLGFGFTRYQHGRQLERERNEARSQADRAEQLKDFMIELFGSADPYSPADPERGRAITVVEALALGADRARSELVDRPVLRADLLSSIASVYESLDQNESALALIREVLDIRHAEDVVPTAQYASELGRYADLLALTGEADSAEATWQQRQQLEIELHGPEHPRVADALLSQAYFLDRSGEYERAYENRSNAERILRAAGPSHHELLASVLGAIAENLLQLQRASDAEPAAQESLDLTRQIFADEHPSTAMARVHLAQVLHARGRLDESITLYREALPVLERTLGIEHRNTQASWNNLGIVLTEAEDFAGAEQVHRRILEMRRQMSGGTDNRDVASSLQNLAASLIRQSRFAEAESLAFAARDIYIRTTPDGHYLRAFPLLTVAEARLFQSDGVGAERIGRQALAILRDALPSAHFATAVAECRIGAALALQGRLGEARPLVLAALTTLESNEQTPERFILECARARDEVAR
jgi:serine/threonine-protein kinase